MHVEHSAPAEPAPSQTVADLHVKYLVLTVQTLAITWFNITERILTLHHWCIHLFYILTVRVEVWKKQWGQMLHFSLDLTSAKLLHIWKTKQHMRLMWQLFILKTLKSAVAVNKMKHFPLKKMYFIAHLCIFAYIVFIPQVPLCIPYYSIGWYIL